MAPSLLDVAIVGGGPGGLAAAKGILTARPDLRVGVFERSCSITAPRGASLGLLPNGIRALEAMDPQLRDDILALDAHHVSKRTFSRSGELLAEVTGEGVGGEVRKYGDMVHVAWHDLRLALAGSLPEGVLQTGVALEGFEGGEEGVTVRFREGQEERRVCARVLVGCDGNQSAVRAQLLGDGPPHFIGTAIWRAVLPSLPPCWPFRDACNAFWVDMARGQAFACWTLQGGRLSLLGTSPWREQDLGQLADAQYIQEPQQRAEQRERAKQRLAAAFGEGWAPQVQHLIHSIDPATLTEHGQFYRTAEECGEWGRGRVTLLGDAAHLSTPLMAQGTSQAFEDALELARCIHDLGPTPAALRRYESTRRQQNALVQATSVQLFRDMMAGRGQRDAETRANIDNGFIARTFDPLPRKTSLP